MNYSCMLKSSRSTSRERPMTVAFRDRYMAWTRTFPTRDKERYELYTRTILHMHITYSYTGVSLLVVYCTLTHVARPPFPLAS